MNCVNTPAIKTVIRKALCEDIGKGDITTRSIIPKNIKTEAVIIAKEKGIICGLNIAGMVFKSVDPGIKYLPLFKDGSKVEKNAILAEVSGRATSILSAERVALNFLGFLSGIASRTREFVIRVQGYPVKILDTRKTIPGLRQLEKYAVKTAGGSNHRNGLYDMVLIKDNHLDILKHILGIKKNDMVSLVKKLRKRLPRGTKIEIEVSGMNEFEAVLSAHPDIIMLDNMAPKDIKRAVRKRDSSQKESRGLSIKLEASGNINLKNIRSYAACGVDFISLGTLTKDIQALDISLEFNKKGN